MKGLVTMKKAFERGYKNEFLEAIKDMRLIKGIKGLNTDETGKKAWIDKDATKIVVLKYIDKNPMIPVFVWYNMDISHKSKSLNNGGYQLAKIEKKMILVHRAIAYTWLPEPENGKKEISFKNGFVNDNRADNLEWVSRRENPQQAWNKPTEDPFDF